MELSTSDVANHIQKLQCLYSNFVAKQVLHLQVGHCDYECMYNKSWLIKSYINIIKNFYDDGKICDACTIVGNTYKIISACTQDPNNIYPNIPIDFQCFFEFETTTLGASIVGVQVIFLNDNTAEGDKADGNTFGPHPYTYDAETQILTTNWGISSVPFNIRFSDDCSKIILSGENPDNEAYLEVHMEAINNVSSACLWKENCFTEEEIDSIIKQTYSLLGSNCNCN